MLVLQRHFVEISNYVLTYCIGDLSLNLRWFCEGENQENPRIFKENFEGLLVFKVVKKN